MLIDLQDKLVIGIASTALFELGESDTIFREKGLEAYRDFQRKNESIPLERGTAFPLVKGLLEINEKADAHLVEVVLMSRNDADSGYRILNSIEHHGLKIERSVFTDGRPPFEYLRAFSCSLYLSTKKEEVVNAIRTRFPAALVYKPPLKMVTSVEEVRIAFDGDAVLFSDEADRVFQQEGFAGFKKYEALLEKIPLEPGPLTAFLEGVSRIQRRFPEAESPIRTSLVTARSMPTHKRVINTLREWNIRLDESFFLGGMSKAKVLEILRPHIFFDDQQANLEPASPLVPVAEVPAEIDTGGERR